MSARRKQGRVLVLGSTKLLPPEASGPPPRTSSLQHHHHASPSSSSTASLNSRASTPHFLAENQDLTSRISLDNDVGPHSIAPAASGAQLSCPICNEEMVWTSLCEAR